MYLSLSHALHSLRNPHFSGRSHAHLLHAKKNQEVTASGKAFEEELCCRLSQLQSIGDQGSLSLSWLDDAVKVVLFTCAQISNLLPKITCTEKEKALLEWNLEDTLSLLDVCNGLKEVLNDVQHYVMLVRYAARRGMDLRDGSVEELPSKLSCLRSALDKSAEFMRARVEENSRHNKGRSKLETCSSMLRRMVEPAPDASLSSKRAASNALFNDMDAAKMLAVFVCSVLAIALSVKPKRRLLQLPIADQPSWLESLQSLQQNVKKLTDSGIEHGKVAFLKELDAVRAQTDKLSEKINKMSKQETPISEIDGLDISSDCEKLSKEADELQGGLLVLQQHMDGLFRMLVTIRVDFLDALCHV